MGVTYAHEHLVIDGGRPVEMSPDFLLADVDRMSAELRDAAEAGLRTAVDAMPADAGATRRCSRSCRGGAASTSWLPRASTTRSSTARRTGACARPRTSWRTCSWRTSSVGIDARDYSGPIVDRTAVSGRDRQDRRQPGRPLRSRRAGLPRGGGGPPADRRARPHPLRGRDRGAGAGPPPDRGRRPGRADLAESRRQGRRTAATTASCWRPARPSSTTRRSGGATARTARSTSSRRLSRTGGPVR